MVVGRDDTEGQLLLLFLSLLLLFKTNYDEKTKHPPGLRCSLRACVIAGINIAVRECIISVSVNVLRPVAVVGWSQQSCTTTTTTAVIILSGYCVKRARSRRADRAHKNSVFVRASVQVSVQCTMYIPPEADGRFIFCHF